MVLGTSHCLTSGGAWYVCALLLVMWRLICGFRKWQSHSSAVNISFYLSVIIARICNFIRGCKMVIKRKVTTSSMFVSWNLNSCFITWESWQSTLSRLSWKSAVRATVCDAEDVSFLAVVLEAERSVVAFCCVSLARLQPPDIQSSTKLGVAVKVFKKVIKIHKQLTYLPTC